MASVDYGALLSLRCWLNKETNFLKVIQEVLALGKE